MKVLFISSGNSKLGISPIIKNQGNSLIKEGVALDFYTIKGKGLKGYLKAIPNIKAYIKKTNPNVVHVHYSLSAFAVSFATRKPVVVSLMGSDLKAKNWYKYLIKMFNKLFWSAIIVKSEDMKEDLGISSAHVIPNGVDYEVCRPVDKELALKKTAWDPTKRHVLFAANPNNFVKNFTLAKAAFEQASCEGVELQYLDGVPFDQIVYYHNAADVVLLTSKWEGSPNVIKEAMACNVPIVATNVGDIAELTHKTAGCFITSQHQDEIAISIKKALDFKERTTGREDIKHLNSKIIAKRLIDLYHSTI